MKKILVIILLIISNINHLKCADNYELGDILYVWAKSGLNVRVSPGTDSNIIAKIPFGESVLIWGKTDRTYNVMGIDTANFHCIPNLQVEPLIFKGNWVQIQMLNGGVGYVIDQYLLMYKPQKLNRNFSSELNVEIISLDTLFQRPAFIEGGTFIGQIKTNYKGGLTALTQKTNNYSRSVEILIPNATIEEILVLFSSSLHDFTNIQLFKNCKTEVIFATDKCVYKVKQDGRIVTVDFEKNAYGIPYLVNIANEGKWIRLSI